MNEDLTDAADGIAATTPDADLVRGLQRMLALHRSGPHYTATVIRCDHYWDIEIDNLGAIQVDFDVNLSHRDVILHHAAFLDRDVENAHVFIHYPAGATA